MLYLILCHCIFFNDSPIAIKQGFNSLAWDKPLIINLVKIHFYSVISHWTMYIYKYSSFVVTLLPGDAESPTSHPVIPLLLSSFKQQLKISLPPGRFSISSGTHKCPFFLPISEYHYLQFFNNYLYSAMYIFIPLK